MRWISRNRSAFGTETARLLNCGRQHIENAHHVRRSSGAAVTFAGESDTQRAEQTPAAERAEQHQAVSERRDDGIGAAGSVRQAGFPGASTDSMRPVSSRCAMSSGGVLAGTRSPP